MNRGLALALAALLLSGTAHAQMDADFSLGGAARIGWSTTTCDASAAGALRYNSSSGGRIDFCNGTAWANVGSAGGSIDALSDGVTNYATDFNLFIGQNAGAAIAPGGQNNLAIGQDALDLITTGDANLAIGRNALGAAVTSVNSSIAIGYGGLSALNTGSGNVAIGSSALGSTTYSVGNTAIGFLAMANSAYTEGSNTAVGSTALHSNTGSANVAVGAGALDQNRRKDGSVAVGYQAMFYADDTTTAGMSYNTAVGYRALRGSTTAANNTGTANTAIGHSALLVNQDGLDNTAIGYNALAANVGGTGAQGNSNTALGKGVLQLNTLGEQNTGVGAEALESNVSGVDNTAVGFGALRLATGSNNTALGWNAGSNLTTGGDNIIIGRNVAAPSASGTAQLNIGDTIYGDLTGDNIRIGGSGTVSAGPLIASPPAAQTIAATNTITANACGTTKLITSAGAVTTDTTNTFTAPVAAYAGCCMDVINTGANNITLDANANFLTIGGANQVLGQYDAVRVCSNGASWFQISAVAGNQ